MWEERGVKSKGARKSAARLINYCALIGAAGMLSGMRRRAPNALDIVRVASKIIAHRRARVSTAQAKGPQAR